MQSLARQHDELWQLIPGVRGMLRRTVQAFGDDE
jgi:hypothetical protein